MHQNVDEVIIIDTSPAGSEIAHMLEKHCNRQPKARYIRLVDAPISSCLYRNRIFDESQSDVTWCVDSHVLFWQGASDAIRRYYVDGDHRDLLVGPFYDSSESLKGTNQMLYAWEPYEVPETARVYHSVVCRGGSLGVWVVDPRGLRGCTKPFEVQQQGLGNVVAYRGMYPGTLPDAVGHGGTETYTVEKCRANGGRVMCHPLIACNHCWTRGKTPYRTSAVQRVQNYLKGFADLKRADLWNAAAEHLMLTWPSVASDVIGKIACPVS